MAAVFRYDAATRLIHLLLALLGIAALISGQFAGDYRRAVHTGFDLHRWIGIAIAYVALHAGAVVVHSLAGHPVWRRMA